MLRRTLIWIALFACFGMAVGNAFGARKERVIGGKTGTSWAEAVYENTILYHDCNRKRWIALDDTTVPDAIQPMEFKSRENIMTNPDAPENMAVNLLGFEWTGFKITQALRWASMELGWNPRVWSGGRVFIPSLGVCIGSATPSGSTIMVDGNKTSAVAYYREQVAEFVPYVEYLERLGAAQAAVGLHHLMLPVWPMETSFWTFDLGIPLPVKTIRFYPPPTGVHPTGVPYSEYFPKAYEVSVTDQIYPWLVDEEPDGLRQAFEDVVARVFYNTEQDVEVELPSTRFVRHIRIAFDLMPQTFGIAEVEVYGEGFPAVARYISEVLDFGEPVTFGKVCYKFTKFRKTPDGEAVEDPDAAVRLVLQTKSGRDDSPLAYHVYSEWGKEVEVGGKEYEESKKMYSSYYYPVKNLEGYQASVIEETERWDMWSSPYRSSEVPIRSSDARRYFQFKFNIETDDPFAYGRLDSLVFEYSPLLCKDVVGSVSLWDAPIAEETITTEVPLGVDTTFCYTIEAVFDSPAQKGFDGVRIALPSKGEFVRLEMGDVAVPQEEIVVRDDSVNVEQGVCYLEACFPSHRITRARNAPLKAVFKTTLLSSGSYFTTEVFDTQSDNFPQLVNPKGGNPNVLRVFASESEFDVLASVEIAPGLITPNGDGQNDEAEIAFTLFGVEETPVLIEVHDLSGTRVREVLSENRSAGTHTERWDGMNAEGDLVSPGVYLCRTRVEADAGVYEKVKAILVVY